MASIRKQGDCCEIRECLSTPRGPRQVALARFRGTLTPEVLERAEGRARRPFVAADVIAKAESLGIPVSRRRRYPEARALLARLQRGGDLDPMLVHLLRTALRPLASRALPEHLSDAAEWIGQPERERGEALRGLLRTADQILRSRAPLRVREAERFPRFASAPAPIEAGGDSTRGPA